jgi:hypothetical protein
MILKEKIGSPYKNEDFLQKELFNNMPFENTGFITCIRTL